VFQPPIHEANVDTTTIQKLRSILGQLEGAKISLIMRSEKSKNPREMLMKEEGDVVVHEKSHKECVVVTSNNKKELNLLKIRKKDVKKESHMSLSP